MEGTNNPKIRDNICSNKSIELWVVQEIWETFDKNSNELPKFIFSVRYIIVENDRACSSLLRDFVVINW